jgi:hypothetical protein
MSVAVYGWAAGSGESCDDAFSLKAPATLYQMAGGCLLREIIHSATSRFGTQHNHETVM